MSGRIRTVKPELFTHEALYDLEEKTGLPVRLAFIGLLTQCDREGRFKWRPRAIKASVDPYSSVDFAAVLEALASAGFVQKYAVAEETYGCVPSFATHQRIGNREAESTLPSPDDGAPVPQNVEVASARFSTLKQTSAVSSGREGKGNGREGEGKGKGNKPAADPNRAPVGRVKLAPIPPGWEPDTDLQELATSLGLDSKQELERMRDWAEAKGERKADWGAAYRNWLRRSAEYRTNQRPPGYVANQRAFGQNNRVTNDILELIEDENRLAAGGEL